MKKILITFIIVSTISCQTRNKNQADKNVIHKWITNYEEAIRTANIDALLSGVSDAVVYFPPNQQPFSGKENLRKWFLNYFNYYEPAELLLARDIKINEDIAYLTCNYSVSVKIKDSGEEFRDIGKLINILKREQLNNWKCIYSIWNSNTQTIDFHSQIPADFSGEWEMDLSRSTRSPNIISSRMVITQKGNNIYIRRFHNIEGKDPLNSESKCTIGREIKSSSKSETLITSSFWSSDKQSFTIIEKLLSGGKEYKRTTNYSLTLKGECLKITSLDLIPTGLLIPSEPKQIVMTYNKISHTK